MKKIIEFFLEYFNACSTSSKIDNKTITVGGVIKGIIVVHGEPHKVAKSTKGMLNKGYLERVIDHLVENYGIDPAMVLNPELYKKFRDEIYPMTSKYDTFIDYMVDLKLLK